MRLLITQAVAWGIVISIVIVIVTYKIASWSLLAALAFIITMFIGMVVLANIGTHKTENNEPGSISDDRTTGIG